MRRAVLRLTLMASISALLCISIFSWTNLRGIGPACKRPSGDVSRLIGSAREGSDAANNPLVLPSGFSISVFADGLGQPRVMILDPGNTLLVSIPSQGKVVALPDLDADGVADRVVTVIDDLNRPHGMAVRCSPDCRLFIAEKDRVTVYSYDQKNLRAVKLKQLADLPGGGGHSTRTLLFLPGPRDDKLLISVGSSCNVCNEDDWRRARILSVPADGGSLSTFASGLRNAVFLTVHPGTQEVWATEMGRDLLGDDLPPDEINIIEKGRDYGWPFCYGKNIHDDAYDPGKKSTCKEPETYPSHIDIPAHSAPLGLAFFPETGWPAEYRNNLLVCYHGSWNRSIPTGYKIVRYRLDDRGKLLTAEDFATGWLAKDGSLFGRPVDIMIRPDGAIFVSDDKAGVIYRIKRDNAPK